VSAATISLEVRAEPGDGLAELERTVALIRQLEADGFTVRSHGTLYVVAELDVARLAELEPET
jgi:hypothetical protein